MMMNPIYGVFAVFAVIANAIGIDPLDWRQPLPLLSSILIVSWQWTPFAILIFITSLQCQDQEQREAALLDGAGFWSRFYHLTLPHLVRPISVVIMIQMIFHLSIFAEIFATTGGWLGNASINPAFLIISQALLQFDVGVASAGGVFAVIIAIIVAFFLVRLVGKNLMA